MIKLNDCLSDKKNGKNQLRPMGKKKHNMTI